MTMTKKDYINIAGIVLTFVACTGTGFGGAYLARMPRTTTMIASIVDGGNAGGGTVDDGKSAPQTERTPQTPALNEPLTTPETPGGDGNHTSAPSDSLNNGSGTSMPSGTPDAVAEESVDDAATREPDPDDVCTPDLPMIAKVSGPAMYPTTSPERIGYQLAVTFTQGVRVRGADLLHDGQVKYSSAKGTFNDVMPVNDAKYILRVIAADGTLEEREVSGFRLMPKWTAGFIAEQLNAPAQDKQFYRHFTSDLKLSFEGISDAGNIPVSLSSFFTSMSAMGWRVTSVKGLEYDRYNRIKSITIIITEQ